MRAFYGAWGDARMEKALKQLVNLLEPPRASGYLIQPWGWRGGKKVPDGMDTLELGVIAAVIGVVLYWLVVLPARERKKRGRERQRRTESGAGRP